MKVTIVYDNTTTRSDLKADWGWSCFIETAHRNILFDTGGNGKILLENLATLRINPETVHDIVISHGDFDHIGGLSAFLNENSKATIHVPFSFRGIRYPNQVNYYKSPKEIYPGIFLTGEMGNEQSLAISTDSGLVLLIGCAHPGVPNILEVISQFGHVHGIIGGLHGFNNFEYLKHINIVCSTHCTKHKEDIRKLFPEKYIKGGVGKVITII